MDDKMIVEMLFDRDEKALEELSAKYSGFCRGIALRLLGDMRDAEECASDAFLAAWQSIPPHNPENLSAYLGRIVRNKAISRLRSATAAKRCTKLETMLSELEECLPSRGSAEESIEAAELSEVINDWLSKLKEEDRVIFILRYWHGYSPKEISMRSGLSPASITRKLFRLRQRLKKIIETQGVTL